jgi:hypothetical protein
LACGKSWIRSGSGFVWIRTELALWIRNNEKIYVKQLLLNNKAVLWIRNNLVWILLFKTGQLNNWQILCVHNGTAASLFKDFKDFRRKINVIEDELDQFENVKKVRSGSGTIIPDPT